MRFEKLLTLMMSDVPHEFSTAVKYKKSFLPSDETTALLISFGIVHAKVINMATRVDITDIHHTVWTNGSDFITCKMTVGTGQS